MAANYKQLWDNALQMIRETLTGQDKLDEYERWFKPIVFEAFDTTEKKLMLQVPSRANCDYIEKNYLKPFADALIKYYGKGVRLGYRIPVVEGDTITEDPDAEIVTARKNASQKTNALPDIDPQLDMSLNFKNFIEGDSNKLSRSVGINVAEHPKSSKFNPLYIYGPSGCGKTHLINAIGVRAKEMYPNLRVLYLSARIFEQQFTTARGNNTINDFLAFYQTLDVLIVDDIHEWIGKEKTQDAFFHIFDYLFRRSKRIILACDRSPSQLRGMHERLITRFACGATCEILRPNSKLCLDILKSKIARDGLTRLFPDDVLQYISETVNGSVRDLQGVINTLMVYSITGNSEIDMALAERVVKRVVAYTEETPVSLDYIIDAVCEQCNVTSQDINGKSRKAEYVLARQIVMYLAKRLTNLPDSRIGRLIGGRDHSTVIHSCKKMDDRLKHDKALRTLVGSIEKSLKAK